jgi:hypothetical protein
MHTMLYITHLDCDVSFHSKSIKERLLIVAELHSIFTAIPGLWVVERQQVVSLDDGMKRASSASVMEQMV